MLDKLIVCQKMLQGTYDVAIILLLNEYETVRGEIYYGN